MKKTLLVLAIFGSFTAFAADPTPPTFKNESEAGVVISAGNADSQSYNFKQTNSYDFSGNLLKLSGHFLTTNAKGVESARNWDLGLRYERNLYERLGAYAGQNIESDIFAGYTQRYNTDVGAKYGIQKTEAFQWDAEAGYRFSSQNNTNRTSLNEHFLRLYTELTRDWTKTFSTKYWFEALPNLSDSAGYRFNTELSSNAALSEIFSIKLGYLIRYNNTPPAGAAKKTDTTFTTALVAKF